MTRKLPINQIICGDCLEVMKDFPDNSVDLVLTDPPYVGVVKEEWDKKEVVNKRLSELLFILSKENASLYCWCGIGEKNQSLLKWFPIFSKNWFFKDLVTWKKQRGMGMRKGWLYTREEIMWYVKDNNNFIWNEEYQYDKENKRAFTVAKYKGKMKGGDNIRLTNVWTDIFEPKFGTSPQNSHKIKEELGHYTSKPLKALERIILAHTKEADLILDPFCGSGTTCVAAKKLGRRYIGIDISEEYCDIARKRIKERKTGISVKQQKQGFKGLLG